VTSETYTVVARRSGDRWAITVRELPGVFTQARRLDEIADTAKEAIGLFLELDPADVSVDVKLDLPDGLTEDLDALREAREAARRANEQLAVKQARVVEGLSRRGRLSLREVAAMLGISHQRVAQILEEPNAGTI
jgi:predicted RNase H-like HicB family nuclease